MSGSPVEQPVVMLVDDNQQIRDVVRETITIQLGSQVQIVEMKTAEEAYEYAKEVRGTDAEPKLAIIDLVMPGSFGGDFLSVLLKSTCRNVKTVLFTASDDTLLPYFKAYQFDEIIHKVQDGVEVLAQKTRCLV